MMGIIDWRVAQCEAKGVSICYNSWATVDMVTAEAPDAVIIATGGLPSVETLGEGRDFVVSAWDIISGDVKPGSNVLIYDDAGDHAGLQAAEIIARAGGKVEIMTRDRSFAPEVMAMNLVPYMRELQKRDVTFTVTYLVEAVRRSGNQLLAVIGSDYGGIAKEQLHDQIVVNYGTKPSDELYFELKPLSANRGAVNYERLINGTPQEGATGFQLYRIGDAVAARNTHAAIHDANRLVRTL
jgi:pyruvate/2-oxoglutarate dehydrogenase complex dihydrolipoamide dehydrogenase (E3) component